MTGEGHGSTVKLTSFQWDRVLQEEHQGIDLQRIDSDMEVVIVAEPVKLPTIGKSFSSVHVKWTRYAMWGVLVFP
jgi:hypothetical protein